MLLDRREAVGCPAMVLLTLVFLVICATLAATWSVVAMGHGLRLLNGGLRELMQLLLILS